MPHEWENRIAHLAQGMVADRDTLKCRIHGPRGSGMLGGLAVSMHTICTLTGQLSLRAVLILITSHHFSLF